MAVTTTTWSGPVAADAPGRSNPENSHSKWTNLWGLDTVELIGSVYTCTSNCRIDRSAADQLGNAQPPTDPAQG